MLLTRSFKFFNIAQFLGALNDNIFKLLIVFLLIDVEGPERTSVILATAGAVFVIPFLLFSQLSGVLADRKSKRNVIVAMKLLEFFVMTLGVLFFWLRSAPGSYFVLFMMATQSAIFSPSKFGIVPEIVPKEKISKANGILTMFTYLAIILGTFLAAFLTDVSGRNFVFTSSICTLIALAGFIASLQIEKTPPSGCNTKYNFFFLAEVYTNIRRAYKRSNLLTAMFGAAFFLFLGAFMQFNIIPFGMDSLQLTDVKGGYLFLLIALGIGIGSVLAGKISGRVVELGLVPIGGFGIIICALLLFLFSTHLFAVVGISFVVGLFAGCFVVPLESFIQVTSADKFRGQIIAAKNFMSFLGVLCASAMLYLVAEVWHLTPRQGFLIMSFIASLMTIIIMMMTFDHFIRFIALITTRLFFRLSSTGCEEIERRPKIIVCNHASWTKTFLLLATQRRGMRLIVKCRHRHFKWLAPIYRFFKIIPLHDHKNPVYITRLMCDVHNSLKRGFSVCVFMNSRRQEEVASKNYILHYDLVAKVFNETSCPIVPVRIYRQNKTKNNFYIWNVLRHGRTKVHVVFDKPIAREKPIEEIRNYFL